MLHDMFVTNSHRGGDVFGTGISPIDH